MSTYTKIFGHITESTIWLEPDATRLLWITLLVSADRHGEVMGSVPGYAAKARIDLAECRKAFECLLSPDPDSRDTEKEGRRIEKIPGGWRIINHEKYRALGSDEDRKAKAALRQKRFRERALRDSNATITPILASEAEAETETDTDTEADKQKQKQKQKKTLAPSNFSPESTTAPKDPAVSAEASPGGFSFLCKDGSTYVLTERQEKKLRWAFRRIRHEVEYRKMQAWLEANPRKRKSQAGMFRFITAWLSKLPQDPTLPNLFSPEELEAEIKRKALEMREQTSPPTPAPAAASPLVANRKSNFANTFFEGDETDANF
jgi:hypothetical protein